MGGEVTGVLFFIALRIEELSQSGAQQHRRKEKGMRHKAGASQDDPEQSRCFPEAVEADESRHGANISFQAPVIPDDRRTEEARKTAQDYLNDQKALVEKLRRDS